MPKATRLSCARDLANGKGRVFVNNQAATVGVLKQLAPELALVHAQTETLTSFDQAQQRILLDRFGGISTDTVSEAYLHWHAAEKSSTNWLRASRMAADGRPVELSTQRNREKAQLQTNEDEALETEKRVLANAEKLYAAAMGAFEQLYEGGTSAEVAMRAAVRNVEELTWSGTTHVLPGRAAVKIGRAIVGDVSPTSSITPRASTLRPAPRRN